MENIGRLSASSASVAAMGGKHPTPGRRPLRRSARAAWLSTVASVVFAAGWATPALADPAVFFTADVDDGPTTFTNVLASTVQSPAPPPVEFVVDLRNEGSQFQATSGGTTVYVTATRTGQPVSFNTAGLTNANVVRSNTGVAGWNEMVAEGIQFQFFADASRTTSFLVNAVGMEVNDWGTCCYTSGISPTGAQTGSGVWMVFADANNTLSNVEIGQISSRSQRGTFAGSLVTGNANSNNHFVAAINDANTYSAVTLVPTGTGEVFSVGGRLRFSTVAIGSVPSGSSSSTLPLPSAPSLVPITASSNAMSALGVSLTYVFEGGTLNATTNTADDFTVNTTGGTGKIDVDTGFAAIFSGDFSGAGTSEKVNGGTLVLTGDHTQAGGWVVSGGILQIGNGGTLGSVSENIENNARVVFNRSDAVSYAGVISGSGSLTQSGTSLTLTGMNTYTGETRIDSGATLALAIAGSIAASSGVVADGTFDISGTTVGAWIRTLSGNSTGGVTLGARTLTLTNASTTFSGVISGSGVLTISGGIQGLRGANTYTGETRIDSGAELLLLGAGSIAASSGVLVDGTFDISLTDAGASITTLSGTGSVALGALTLTLTNASTTFAGVIAGSGGLTVGGGTETLTGTNTYTGATTINSGATLALSGTGSIAASSGVASNGTFDISGTTAGASIRRLSGTGGVTLGARTLTLTNASTTFAGVIAGSGGLTVGGVIQTLTGANTYTGATTINSGATLVIGANGATGAIAGTSAVVNNGVLVLNRSNSITFANNVSGAGQLWHFGSGTTTLTGTNTYTGITAISAGVLVVGSGTAGTLGTGNVLNAASLHFARTDTVTIANAISGAGTVQQIGSGTTILTGLSGYTGATTVRAGTLRVNGAIASSSVTVQSGATLGGTGVVGATNVLSGGRLAPGDFIGTLLVNGDLTLQSGANYDVDFSGVAADRTNAIGAIAINGALNVAPTNAPYGLGTRQTILATQNGAITGAFTSVTGTSGVAMTGLRFDTLYENRNVDLLVTPASYANLTAAGINLSVNQVRTGFGVDAVRPAAGTRLSGAEKAMFDRLYQLNAPQVALALTELSGEVHTAAVPLASRAVSLFGQTMLDTSAPGRLCPVGRDADASGAELPDSNRSECGRGTDASIWLAPFASSGHVDGDTRMGSGNRQEQIIGAAIGVDFASADGSTMGFGLAAGNASAELSGDRGQLSGDFIQFGVWGLTNIEGVEVGVSAGYSTMDADTQRDMRTLGVFGIRSNYSINTGFVRMRASYNVYDDQRSQFGPYATFEAMSSNRDNFIERMPAGTHPSGVSAASRTGVTANSELGLQFSGVGIVDETPMMALVRIGWRAGLANDERYLGSFTDLPNGRFLITGAQQNVHSAVFSADLNLPVRSNVLLGAGMNGEFGSNSNYIAGTVRLSVAF